MYRFISWLLGTSIFAAACALALTLGTERLLQGRLLPLLSPLHLLVAGCTLAEYNVHYLLNTRAPLQRHGAGYSRWWHPALCIAGGILCIIALPSLSRNLIVLLAVSGCFALLYSAPVLPFRPKRSVNDYGITKISVLTITWVVVTTVFPALYLKLPWNAAGAELLWRALLILPLCLAFDLRDVIADRQRGIQTLAGALGEAGSYRSVYVILVLLAAAAGALYFFISPDYLRAGTIVLVAAVAMAAVSYSRRHPHPFVYSGLVDGVMLLYGFLMTIK